MLLIEFIVWFVVFLLLDVGVMVAANHFPSSEELKLFKQSAALRIIYTLMWPLTIPIIAAFELMCLVGKYLPKFYNVTLKKLEDLFQ